MAIQRKFHNLDAILIVGNYRIDNKTVRMQNIFDIFLHQTLYVAPYPKSKEYTDPMESFKITPKLQSTLKNQISAY